MIYTNYEIRQLITNILDLVHKEESKYINHETIINETIDSFSMVINTINKIYCSNKHNSLKSNITIIIKSFINNPNIKINYFNFQDLDGENFKKSIVEISKSIYKGGTPKYVTKILSQNCFERNYMKQVAEIMCTEIMYFIELINKN